MATSTMMPLEEYLCYLAMGLGAIWVVDPRRRKLSTVDAEGTHPVKTFNVPLSSYILPAAEIFAELDQKSNGG